jgi:hypothetical protein
VAEIAAPGRTDLIVHLGRTQSLQECDWKPAKSAAFGGGAEKK